MVFKGDLQSARKFCKRNKIKVQQIVWENGGQRLMVLVPMDVMHNDTLVLGAGMRVIRINRPPKKEAKDDQSR